jgi:hypothetical protein
MKALRHPKASSPKGLKPKFFSEVLAAMKAPCHLKAPRSQGLKPQIFPRAFIAALEALRHPKAFASVQAPTLIGFSR